MKRSILSLALITALAACSDEPSSTTTKLDETLTAQTAVTKADDSVKADTLAAQQYHQMLARFVDVDMQVDLASLSDIDKQVLAKMVRIANILDGVYLKQTYEANPQVRKQISELADSPHRFA